MVKTYRQPAQSSVPWSQPQASQEEQDAAAAFEDQPNGLTAVPTFAGVDPIPPSPEEMAARQRMVDAAFAGEPVEQKSPFAPKPKPKADVAEEEVFPMGDAPSWGDLVKFVQKHGDVIIQLRHPQPRGECVDTIYRGVTCFRHPETQLRHKDLGWIDWADAQYE